MKDVKFRGKDIKTNEWVYGGYYKHLKRTPCPMGDSIKDTDYEYLIINSGFSDWNLPKPVICFVVDETTVGQYTGFKDMNDVEIYEGDIIEYTFDVPGSTNSSENGLKKRLGEVNWNEWRSSFAVYGRKKLSNQDLFHYVRNGNRVKVVGNKFDNPDLIESLNA